MVRQTNSWFKILRTNSPFEVHVVDIRVHVHVLVCVPCVRGTAIGNLVRYVINRHPRTRSVIDVSSYRVCVWLTGSKGVVSVIDLSPCTKQPCELKLGTNVNATVIFASSECQQCHTGLVLEEPGPLRIPGILILWRHTHAVSAWNDEAFRCAEMHLIVCSVQWISYET